MNQYQRSPIALTIPIAWLNKQETETAMLSQKYTQFKKEVPDKQNIPLLSIVKYLNHLE